MTSADINDIGATSFMTAQLRALETARTDRIVEDEWAALLVAAAGAALPPGAETFVAYMREQIAVRTRFLDDTLLTAARAGCTQVVLVAAGMDSRAFRLDWPAGTTVYDVDQASVLGFKNAVLADHDAVPRCERRVVAADLREHWLADLHAAGHDDERPTAWLVEGLLYSFDEAAADRLLSMITAASAPGSTLAFDHLEAAPAFLRALTDISPDLAALWKGGPRDPGTWLRDQGWNPRVRDLGDEAALLARPVPEIFDPTRPGAARSWLVTADR